MGAMMSRMGAHCEAPTMNDDGTTISLAVTCDIAGGKLTTNSLVTRDGPDAITSHSKSHMVGGSFKMSGIM